MLVFRQSCSQNTNEYLVFSLFVQLCLVACAGCRNINTTNFTCRQSFERQGRLNLSSYWNFEFFPLIRPQRSDSYKIMYLTLNTHTHAAVTLEHKAREKRNKILQRSAAIRLSNDSATSWQSWAKEAVWKRSQRSTRIIFFLYQTRLGSVIGSFQGPAGPTWRLDTLKDRFSWRSGLLGLWWYTTGNMSGRALVTDEALISD